ncbi:hypothetical protein P12x_005242 [Tundrisphaera lichenicola]|uniref:hyaluronate lyase N-terminal domain-containing protein n=1 Tax=Tundrisphaera lichenicola TaxID=2029860 RepID=UPI003EB80843
MTTATQTQIRRDTATNLNAATPAEGELGYDKTNKRLVVGDGTTAGGTKIPSAKDVQNQTFTNGTVGGTGDAITITNSPAITAYVSGQRFTFKAGAANTTAVTVNVDGLGTKNVKKMNNGALAALVANDIISGGTYDVFYDGTQFQIKGLSEGPYTSGALVYLGTVTAAAASTLDITSKMSSTYDDYLIVLDDIAAGSGSTNLQLLTSTDNGANFDASAGNYAWVYEQIGGTSLVTNRSTSDSKIQLTSGGTVTNLNGEIKLKSVNNTTLSKLIRSDLEAIDGAILTRYDGLGNRGATTSINAVRFKFSSGTITGTAKIYGIAKA